MSTESAIFYDGLKNNFDFSSMIITAIITIAIAVITTLITIKINNLNHKKDEVRKAVELSELFAKELVPIISYITSIYNQIPKDKIVQGPKEAIESGCELEFDYEEMKHYSESNPYRPLIAKFEAKVFLRSRYILYESSCSTMCSYNDSLLSDPTNISVDILYAEFTYICGKLLNTLEYFSMYFCKGLAKEDVVYQSLHQNFRSTVLMLYFDIATVNKIPTEKYYTHIIALFNMWNNKYKEKKQIEECEIARIKEEADNYIDRVQSSTKDLKKKLVEQPSNYKNLKSRINKKQRA